MLAGPSQVQDRCAGCWLPSWFRPQFMCRLPAANVMMLELWQHHQTMSIVSKFSLPVQMWAIVTWWSLHFSLPEVTVNIKAG